MRKLYFILVILGIVTFAHSDIFAQRKTQPRKVTPKTQSAKAPQKPNKSPYQNLAWQSEWGPWTPYYGYPGLLMRSKLMQTMQPAGQPWYNWEVELKNTYSDQITVDIFTGDNDKFKNPAIREAYSDGSVHTIGPGKTIGTSGLRGTKSDVQVYVNLSFANTPRFNFPDGTTGSKIALHSNGAIPPYCKAYNKPFCPNYKEERGKEIVERKEDILKSTPPKLSANLLKQKIAEIIKSLFDDPDSSNRIVTASDEDLYIKEVYKKCSLNEIWILWTDLFGNFESKPRYFTLANRGQVGGDLKFKQTDLCERFGSGTRITQGFVMPISRVPENDQEELVELFKQLAQTMNEK